MLDIVVFMNTNSQSNQADRKILLDKIATITTMMPGTLAEEWRERPSPSGEGSIRLGPYYKYQAWQDGRNVSRRVPASEAAQLREDIDNAKQFEHLTSELARITIEHTRSLRASQGDSAQCKDSKKNLCPRSRKNDSRKLKTSSQKPKKS